MTDKDMTDHLAAALRHLLETAPIAGQEKYDLVLYARARQEARNVLVDFEAREPEQFYP